MRSPTAPARTPTASCSRSATSRRAIPALASGAWPMIRPATSAIPGAQARSRPGARPGAARRHRPDDGGRRTQLQAQTPGQQIIALSRGGLFPHAHRIGGAAPSQGVPVPDPTPSLLELLRFVRTAAVVAEVGGGDWRDAVNALRPVTSELWARTAPARAAALRRAARALLGRPPPPPRARGRRGRRRPARKRPADVRERADPHGRAAGNGVEVTVQERGNGSARTLRVASVVNCTGPTGNRRDSAPYARLYHPRWQSPIARAETRSAG